MARYEVAFNYTELEYVEEPYENADGETEYEEVEVDNEYDDWTEVEADDEDAARAAVQEDEGSYYDNFYITDVVRISD